jgi:hypothetical protein
VRRSSRVDFLVLASVAAGSLVLFTAGQALREGAARLAQQDADATRAAGTPRTWAPSLSAWPGPGPCTISQAHFGGRRAQLVELSKGGVAQFLIIEVGPPDPMLAHQRSDWVRAYAQGADTLWLGEFPSIAAASARAARLCPPALRCWVGQGRCGAVPASAAQVFFGH